MLTEEESDLLEKQNAYKIRELYRISYAIGVNLTKPTFLKEMLRIVNILLLISSTLSLYGHWSMFITFIDDIPKMAETICTAFQNLVSQVKMYYFLFCQIKFYRVLRKVQRHEVLQKVEIFKKGFAIEKPLRKDINAAMDKAWRMTRLQLLYYICSCTCIMCNYFFGALIMNYYNLVKGTPDYMLRLAFPAYYPIWKDKGQSFPYYEIQMYLSSCGLYIAGMCALTFDTTYVVLCQHSVGLVDALKEMIKYSTSPLIPKQRRVEYLRYCINYYRKIEDYVFEVNGLFQHISLIQFLLSLIIMGIVIFQMSISLESDKGSVIRMLMYMSAAGYQICTYCINGQAIITACEGIPTAFFQTDWYNESEEFKYLIKMSIMRSHRVFKYDISLFTVMSYPTLMAFFKTSGSYFLLLRNLSE
ncbi:odorant receptor 63a-like [Teleopsis dalmanni]|uniref:odorant receptor 63a-like n=1 Tax=Teleopsis dalmanni TaxID=139649 RepID=UPI0018CD2E45|nr:odorant receptor 63a-like [Teleopsis dalmanni]